MKYLIKIPSPCSEKWSEMTPTEKGVFCSNCKKEVFDFTNTSNFQISYLLDSHNNLCGKFKPEQLNTYYSSSANSKHSKSGLLFGISAFLSIYTPLFSQNKSTEIIKIEQSKPLSNERIINKKISDTIKINGNVCDDSSGLPGVNIFLKGYSKSTQTDFDGNFSLNIDKNDINNNSTLEISYIGYESQEIKINEKTDFIKIKMVESDYLLGEVIIIKKQNIFRRIGNLFRKKR